MNLTDEQLAVVESDASRVAVIACPGSGKTSTVVAAVRRYRAMHPAQPIICITFTRQAAAEMKARLDSAGVTRVNVNTFHGTCLDMIRRCPSRVGWREGLTVLPESEAKSLWESTREVLGKKGPAYSWLRYGRYGMDGDDDVPFERLIDQYREHLRMANVMDYSTLIEMGIDMALQSREGFPGLICMDEAQDTDARQWEWLENMRPHRVIAVGDPDQSIYGFRGACPEMFHQWSRRAETHSLSGNFRSGPIICGLADQIMDRSQAMRGLAKHGDDDWAYHVLASREDEIEKVASLLSIYEPECPMLTTGVIYRYHEIGRQLSAALTERGVEHVRVVPEREQGLDSPEMVRAVAYMRLSVNPYDEYAFTRFWPDGRVSEICRKAREDATPLLDAAWHVVGADVLQTVLDEAPQYEDILIDGGFSSAQEYLDWYGTRHVDGDPTRESDSELTLMTVHAAKGREFDHVFVVGCGDSSWSGKGRNGSEARRLLYVAVTRAKRFVLLTADTEMTQLVRTD